MGLTIKIMRILPLGPLPVVAWLPLLSLCCFFNLGVLPSNLGWTHKIINLGDLKCWLPTDLCVSNLASLKCSLMPVFDLWKNTHGHGMLIEHLQRATLNNDTSVGYTLWIPSTSQLYEGCCFLQASVFFSFDPRGSQGTHSGSPQKPHCVQESIAPDNPGICRDPSSWISPWKLHPRMPRMWHVFSAYGYMMHVSLTGESFISSILPSTADSWWIIIVPYWPEFLWRSAPPPIFFAEIPAICPFLVTEIHQQHLLETWILPEEHRQHGVSGLGRWFLSRGLIW